MYCAHRSTLFFKPFLHVQESNYLSYFVSFAFHYFDKTLLLHFTKFFVFLRFLFAIRVILSRKLYLLCNDFFERYEGTKFCYA